MVELFRNCQFPDLDPDLPSPDPLVSVSGFGV